MNKKPKIKSSTAKKSLFGISFGSVEKLLFTCVFLIPLFYSRYFPDHFNFPKLGIFLLIISFILLRVSYKGNVIFYKPALLIGLSFVCLVLLREFIFNDSNLFVLNLFVLNIIGFSIFCGFLVKNFTLKIYKILLISASIVSIIGIFQAFGFNFTGIVMSSEFIGKRLVFSTIGNPNFLASFIMGVLPIAYVLKNEGIFQKILFFVLCFGLFFTRCYGAILLTIIAGTIFYIKKRINIKKTLYPAIVVSILIIVSIPYLPNIKGKTDIRIYLYQCVFNSLKINWINGCGAGNFTKEYIEQQGLLAQKYEFPNTNLFREYATAHNEFFQLIIEMGFIPAFFIYGGMGIIFFRCLKNNSKLDISVKTAIILIILHSMISPDLRVFPVMFVLMIHFSYLLGEVNKEVPAESISILSRIIIGLIGFVLVLNFYFMAKSEYYHQFSKADIRFRHYKDSIEHSKTALKYYPFNYENYLVQGTAYYYLKNFDLASKYFSKGFKRVFHLDEYILWADSLFGINKWEEALKILNKIQFYKVFPTNQLAYAISGTIKMHKGWYSKALEDFGFAGKNKNVYYSIAKCLIKTQKYESAERYYTELLNWYPMNEELLFYRGFTRLHQKKYQQAKDDLSIIVKNNQSIWYDKSMELIDKISEEKNN